MALTPEDGAPRETARLGLSGETSVLVATRGTLTRGYPQVVIARNDGYLWMLDDALAPTHTGGRGLSLGGYYSGHTGIGQVPLAADLDGDGASEVVVVDSRQVLTRLATKGATITKGPAVGLQLPGSAVARAR